MKKVLVWFLVALTLLGMTGCAKKPQTPEVKAPNPVATFTMNDGSTMRFELFYEDAPNTVANFITLANRGFYNGMRFYRVVPGCLIQSGDPVGDGTGTPGYSIAGEFAENGFTRNSLSHVRGTISMARTADDMNSAGSQFFIMQGSFPEYDGHYAAFGKAMDDETLRTIDQIANVRTDASQRPLLYSIIRTVTVDTFGFEYEMEKYEKPESEVNTK